jgi:hypothetical protein
MPATRRADQGFTNMLSFRLSAMLPTAATILAASVIVVSPPRAEAQQPIVAFSQTVPLDPRDPAMRRVGALTYRGGIALRSTDPRFGGFSGIHIASDGKTLLAISDRGAWLRLSLDYQRGRLIGVGRAEMGRLIGTKGQPLIGKDGDAEALATLPDGAFLVALERRHRILHYPDASPPFSKRPSTFPLPQPLLDAPANAGIEALVHVGSGFFVTIAERMQAGGGALAAWVGRNGTWEPFAYARKPGMRVTDAALLPSGDLVVLEHRYSVESGSVVRFVRVPRAAIAPYQRVEGKEIALLAPPLTTDNFEGVAARRGQGDEALLYVMSDDNFNPLQRTLLMLFAVRDARPATRPPPR